MFLNKKKWLGCFFLFLAFSTQAQMVHHLLLLINKESQASKYVANEFVALRKIPDRNIVYLSIPKSLYAGRATITPEEFTSLIWNPTQAIIKKRGLENQILTWIYSVDFPIRIKTNSSDKKQMSLMGLTFLKNKIPDLDLVKNGTYLSKLFGGPNKQLTLTLNSMSFEVKKEGLGKKVKVPKEVYYLKNGLGTNMPLPSMMLGYVGENGNTVKEVILSLKKGRVSDHRGIHNGIYLIKTDDIRSKCRDWEFENVAKQLKSRNISVTITNQLPIKAKRIIGLMMGAKNPNPSKIKTFIPGAMAEHLTSWAGEFQKNQTKMTAWIKAGATATAGTVVEPFANPNKSPSATFFSHYTAGCTMIESFYQSISCPLQILLLGDPLAKPYAPRIKLKLFGLEALKSDFTFVTEASIAHLPKTTFIYHFFLDGKEVVHPSENKTYYLRVSDFSDGYHTLRVVAEAQYFIRFSTSIIKPIVINARGRSLAILPDFEKTSEHKYRLAVKLDGQETPEKIQLVSKFRVLDEKPYSTGVQLILDELMLGEGPQEIRAVAIYKDGMKVSSIPIKFGILFNPKTK